MDISSTARVIFYCVGMIGMVSLTAATQVERYGRNDAVFVSYTVAIFNHPGVSDAGGLLINFYSLFFVELITRLYKFEKFGEKTAIKILYWYIEISSHFLIAFSLIYFTTISVYCAYYRPIFD
jgi:hypothetical protein